MSPDEGARAGVDAVGVAAGPVPSRRPRSAAPWLAALGITLVLAAGASTVASDAPDGLERVAADEGFAASAEEHDLAESPLADYEVDGVDGAPGGGMAGVLGVGVTLLVAAGALHALRRPSPSAHPAAPPRSAGSGPASGATDAG